MQRTATLGGLMPVEEIAAHIGELRSTIAAWRLESYARVFDLTDRPSSRRWPRDGRP